MRWLRADYLAAIVFSLAVHAGIAAYVLPEPMETRIAGGEEVAMMVIGDAFADAVMAGEEVDDAEAANDTNPVEPVTETAEAVEEAVQPADTEAAEAVSEDVQANQPLQAIAALADPQSPIATTGEVLKPVPDPPVPQPRPEVEENPTEKKKATKPAAKPENQKPKKQRTQKTTAKTKPREQPAGKKAANKKGSGGKQNANARKSASGSRTAKRSSKAGNAAASNYPGKVYSRIARTRRKNAGGTGTARVSFSISSGGGLAGVRLAKSSGNSRVDSAAVAHVKRAAPFPKPPAGAQRSFVIPIQFKR